MKKNFTNADSIIEKTISDFSHDEKTFTNANNIIEKTISSFFHNEKTTSDFSHDEKIAARFVSKIFHMKLFVFFFIKLERKFRTIVKQNDSCTNRKKFFYQRQRV